MRSSPGSNVDPWIHVPCGLCRSCHVDDSDGTATRYWMPFPSHDPLPTHRATFPLRSWPAPLSDVLHGFAGGSSAVPYWQSGPGSLVSPVLVVLMPCGNGKTTPSAVANGVIEQLSCPPPQSASVLHRPKRFCVALL